MSEQLNAGHWRLDPFKRIQVWVPDGPTDSMPDAFDEVATDSAPPTDGPKRRGPAPEPIEHGTASGYRKHRVRGIPSCEPCRKAEARSCWERRARKRAAEYAQEVAS